MPNSAAKHAELVNDTLHRAVELHQQGHRQHAAALYEAVLVLDKNQSDALQLYGVLCAQAGDSARAVELMERSLAVHPAQPGVLTNLGNVLRSSGQPFRALTYYDEALRLAPAHVVAFVERCRAMHDLGRYTEAMASADAALVLDIDCAAAYDQRGSALVALHRFEQALAAFRRAIELDPRSVDALLSYALTAHEIGLNTEAAAASARALALAPDSLRVQLGHLHCQWPALAGSAAEIAAADAAFGAQLSRFIAWLAAHPEADPTPAAGGTPTYYLAYRDSRNLAALRTFGDAWSRHLCAWAARSGVPVVRPKTAGAAARVGIVSGHVRDHSVYNVITRTLFTALERAGCEVHLYVLSHESDEETTYAATRARHFHHGQKGWREWAMLIGNAQCDLLLYPEIGMDELTLKLAALRLAPVQAASWGHPETSGLPTIDYYLSAAAFEPPGGEQNYSERLVPLANLGCHLQPSSLLSPQPVSAGVHLPSLGIDPDLPFYVCPGTPFKYAPDHDVVYARIAERVGPCQFVFFEFQQRAELSQRLFERIAREFTDRGLDWTRYLRLVPWLAPPAFRTVCAAATGVLDTIGFSGFNTAVHALDSDAPLVAWEGTLMRGRLASGTLRHLGIESLIASTHDGFVDIAARLAHDLPFAERQRELIRAARSRIYDDEATLDDLVRFIHRATSEAHALSGAAPAHG